MKTQVKWPAVFVLLLATFFQPTAHGGEGEILVFVAASLADAMSEIKERFEEKIGGRVFLSFGGSGTLYRQIQKGAPADVFISASGTQVDALELDGLTLLDTRKDLLTNNLVVIAPRQGGLRIERPEDLTQEDIAKIAIGEPGSVPAGSYAKESLENLGLWDALLPKIVPALDVRAVLAYVENRAADAGIVYGTDAMISHEVKVIYKFPEESHTAIIYPAVVLKDSEDEALAREFVDFLSSAEAGRLFEAYGFKTAGGH